MFLACNQTYYGEVGRTYELEVRRPREDRLPFLCYLNFTAAGGMFGDLIQVQFASPNVLQWMTKNDEMYRTTNTGEYERYVCSECSSLNFSFLA